MRITKIIIDCNTIDEFNSIYSKIFGNDTLIVVPKPKEFKSSEVERFTSINETIGKNKVKQIQYKKPSRNKDEELEKKLSLIADVIIRDKCAINVAQKTVNKENNLHMFPLTSIMSNRIKNIIKKKGYLYRYGGKVEKLEEAKAKALESIAKDEEYMDKCRKELDCVPTAEEQMNNDDSLDDYIQR